MKFLVIGNINENSYLNGQAKWLKKKYGPSTIVDLFSNFPSEKGIIKEDLFYDNIFYSYPNNILSYVPGFKRDVSMRLKFLSLPNNYDILQIHFVNLFLTKIAPLFHLKAKKVVVSFWGSDFYKVSNNKLKKISDKILDYADAITLGNPEMIPHFKNHYYPKNQNPYLCYYGNDFVDKIQAIMPENKTYSKQFLGIDENKISVTIGNNASTNNQHLKILDEIFKSEILLNYKNKIEFLIPITYGGTQSYIDSIKSKVERFSFHYKLFDSYFTAEQVIHLRRATDIYIHLPISDAFSGSMREHLFANCILITGTWLPYKILNLNQIYFKSIDSIEQLSFCLDDVLKNYKTELSNCFANTQNIYSISSWESVINDWIHLYDKLLIQNA